MIKVRKAKKEGVYEVEDRDGRLAVLSFKDWLRVIRAIKKLDKLANIVEIELQ